MGSEVPILEFSTGPLVGRGSWPVGAGTHLQCPTLRASQGPGGRPVTQLSFSPRSTQGPVDNHVAGKGPRQGAAAPEVHQDHEGNLGPPPQRRPPPPDPRGHARAGAHRKASRWPRAKGVQVCACAGVYVLHPLLRYLQRRRGVCAPFFLSRPYLLTFRRDQL